MTFRYWKCDPNASTCIIRYMPPWGSGDPEIALIGSVASQWPWLASLFGNAVDTVESAEEQRVSSAMYLHDIWETTDPLVPFATTQIDTIAFPLIGEKHRSFEQDKRDGRIVVGPVSVGSCTRTMSSQMDTADAVVTEADGYGHMGVGAPSNPMGITLSSAPIIPGYECYYCVYYVNYTVYTIATPTYVTSPLISMPGEVPGVSIDTGVVTAAVAACNQGTYDLLTEIAELPQTIAFLSDTVRRVATITRSYQAEVSALERLLSSSPAMLAKKLASAELAFRYAVMPLMYSCQDIRELLKDVERKYAEYRNRKSIEVEYSWDASAPDLLVGDNPACIHRCFIKASYTPDTIANSLIKAIGFNPVATLWELTPLSFVVDWVFNVGDTIVALTSSDDAEMTAATYSVRHESSTWEFSNEPSDLMSPRTTIVLDTYNRIVINPSGHIGLAYNLNMNWKRYLDGTALALQKVLGSIRK